jgi:predicted lipoprotein with Yx(FWY)xxD motif
MYRVATTRLGAATSAVVLFGLIAALFAADASAASRVRLVMTAANKTLGERVLVDRKGMTLYSLSVERRGKFVCTTSACLSLWRPLTVRTGVSPTGIGRLTIVKRRDGRLQVAYRGAPLYSFSGDMRRGDVKGNGLKDVGVWRPAPVSSKQPVATPQPSRGGGYGP